MAQTPPPPPPFVACPVCAALVTDHAVHIEQHVTWHEQTKTLGSKHGAYGSAAGLRDGFAGMPRGAAQHHHAATEDDYSTAKLPPITDTVRRRPPVPNVRELRGAELLRALADELARDEDVRGEDL